MDATLRLRSARLSERKVRYRHLMQAARAMFEAPELERLAPRLHGGHSLAEVNGQGVHGLDPVAATETIAYDFLSKGGKHSRPFIALAVYDALTGGRGTQADGTEYLAGLPDAIKRAALSIETFHKASLVHDDIEDDDDFRYGDQTLHRKFGIAIALNVGDYLIGLGYRLVSREAQALGPDVVSDILDHLADAHMKLSEGQGAELIWRDSRNKRLTPPDALRIYALKTAPAFQAALHTGMRLAGPVDQYSDSIAQFARNLGIAFQIINDLNDWHKDDHNKLSAASDVTGGRPTVLWALALEGLSGKHLAALESLASQPQPTLDKVRDFYELYQRAGAFEKAERLVDTYQHRAEKLADEIQPDELRRLFYYLIDTVLQRRQDDSMAIQTAGG